MTGWSACGSSESIFIILNSTEMNSSPGKMESREVELGSRSWMDCLAAEMFSSCCFSDTVSLCRCSAQPLKKQLTEYTSVFPPAVPASLTLLFWRWLPDVLFAVYWSERTDGLLIGTPTLRAPLSGTFLQTLPDLVTPLKGHSVSPRSCPATRSAPSERVGY